MEELARHHLIKPVFTQGHIGDVLPDKIVYDAMFSSDCLDLPGLWNKKLGVLESPGSLFTCVAPLTIIPFTAEVGAVRGTDFGNGWKRGFPDERARFLIGAKSP
jgi:hypothetical protein